MDVSTRMHIAWAVSSFRIRARPPRGEILAIRGLLFFVPSGHILVLWKLTLNDAVIIPNILMDMVILCLPTFEVSKLVSSSPDICTRPFEEL